MDGLVLKLVETDRERKAAFDVRIRVFVEEQGIPVEEELDELDGTAIHAIALMDGRPVGAGRVLSQGGVEARIGRMAVDAEWRRKGIGGGVLRTLEEAARQLGIRRAVLHAQTYVKEFYAAHGYVQEGEVFLEVGIEHVQMAKGL